MLLWRLVVSEGVDEFSIVAHMVGSGTYFMDVLLKIGALVKLLWDKSTTFQETQIWELQGVLPTIPLYPTTLSCFILFYYTV